MRLGCVFGGGRFAEPGGGPENAVPGWDVDPDSVVRVAHSGTPEPSVNDESATDRPPEGSGHDEVLLMLEQVSRDGVVSCTCSAPDGAAKLSMPSSVLAAFGTTQLSATVRLGRTTTSSVSSDDATVELVGEAMIQGTASFE